MHVRFLEVKAIESGKEQCSMHQDTVAEGLRCDSALVHEENSWVKISLIIYEYLCIQ